VIWRRSSSIPVWACTASTTSAVVTDPNNLPSLPALAVTVMILGTSVVAMVLGGLTGVGVALVAGTAHARRLVDRTAARLEGEALGEQVVAGMAVGDVDDVAALAEPFEIGAQDDLHAQPPRPRRCRCRLGALDLIDHLLGGVAHHEGDDHRGRRRRAAGADGSAEATRLA
jgi:hypothetical protein